MPLKQCISPDEARRIKDLAGRISNEIMMNCGPHQTEFIDGKRKVHKAILGFDTTKSRQIVEDMIWELLLKG